MPVILFNETDVDFARQEEESHQGEAVKEDDGRAGAGFLHVETGSVQFEHPWLHHVG